MISLDHLLIESSVVEAKFSCDLAQCKGACCTLAGGGGAPVRNAEVAELLAAVPSAIPYLSAESRQALNEQGALAGSDGHWETACIQDKECTFVFWENGVALCSFEKAYFNGESTFRKPLSCHLFPIRVENLGGPYLRYEQFDECQAGRDKGVRTNTPLAVSVREAVERAYGADIADALVQLATSSTEGDAV